MSLDTSTTITLPDSLGIGYFSPLSLAFAVLLPVPQLISRNFKCSLALIRLRNPRHTGLATSQRPPSHPRIPESSLAPKLPHTFVKSNRYAVTSSLATRATQSHDASDPSARRGKTRYLIRWRSILSVVPLRYMVHFKEQGTQNMELYLLASVAN